MTDQDWHEVWEHYMRGHITGMVGDPGHRHLVCRTCNRYWK